MAKVNEALRDSLIFERKEHLTGTGSKQVIWSTQYADIYRQYAYIEVLQGQLINDPLTIEIKNILTHSIERELGKRYVRCKSCAQHILHDFEKSTTHKCEACGTINEIKVLIEKP